MRTLAWEGMAACQDANTLLSSGNPRRTFKQALESYAVQPLSASPCWCGVPLQDRGQHTEVCTKAWGLWEVMK